MNFKSVLFAGAALGATSLLAVPTVSDVSWSQSANGLVVVTYKLAGAPAIVTMDVLTNAVNAAEGVSIGAENFANVTGDVNCRIAEDGDYTIRWKPSKSWPGHDVTSKSVRMSVTAWDVAHPPAYLVVDLAESSKARLAFYDSEAALPDGIGSDVYRMTKMVFRRIDATGVPWTWGAAIGFSTDTSAMKFNYSLTNDFYMGVFEVTKAQWTTVTGSTRSNGFDVEAAMRPQTRVSYVNIRCNEASSTNWGTDRSMDGEPGDTVNAANSPNANSFLGRLRLRTNRMKFDLPTEGEWDFAAAAGYGAGYWGDGSPVLGTTTCANLDQYGRYAGNGGQASGIDPTWTTEQGTAKVGSYKPNAWGLYDMSGNVREQCRDWWCTGQDGHNLVNWFGMLHNENHDYSTVVRGGGWRSDAAHCLTSVRGLIRSHYGDGTTGTDDIGFRVVLPISSLQ